MTQWSIELYGDPCRECEYSWQADLDELIDSMAGYAPLIARVVHDASGTEQLNALKWNVSAYVWHVGDNLRIWAERLMAVAGGGSSNVLAYDENQLAATRHYNESALAAALWSLHFSCVMWSEAVKHARLLGVVLQHSTRGELTSEDVIRANVHDAVHHRWDIERTLQLNDRR